MTIIPHVDYICDPSERCFPLYLGSQILWVTALDLRRLLPFRLWSPEVTLPGKPAQWADFDYIPATDYCFERPR